MVDVVDAVCLSGVDDCEMSIQDDATFRAVALSGKARTVRIP